MIQFLIWFAAFSIPLMLLAWIAEVMQKKPGPLAKLVTKICFGLILAIFAFIFLVMLWWLVTGQIDTSIAGDPRRR